MKIGNWQINRAFAPWRFRVRRQVGAALWSERYVPLWQVPSAIYYLWRWG